ncbi:unnamed protein product [Peronospora destructor]|uniref:Reverse transcriptase/retrotransposon-derived protein RNase H-like domain-containing protein n=1 Tax=Peronospora destructor TaxID=86335 RepID=A0AAV0T487_9STRA|nr:unnamed protein product [Peronospora destructor]
MNYAFDCIVGIPWLSRYQPTIDWLSRSVKRRSGYDVSEVFTHLLVASSDWPHVRVVNELATTSSQHKESDGPLCPRSHLSALPWKDFLHDLKAGDIEQVCIVSAAEAASEEVQEVRPKSAEPKSAREERFAAQSWEALRASGNPVYDIAREYADIFPEKIPAELPADRGVRHEIDLVPGSKYCVTRQWPLPRDQVIAIDEFFEGHRKAGHVRESISPHSSPTFCVSKATGGWRIVHAFNKLNDATIPAQTPIPRKDMVLNFMSGSVLFSAIDLTDGFYQILMRPSDIALQVLGLANYLHKYTKDYPGSIQPLSSLLKKDATWTWRSEHQSAFDAVKKSLASALVLIIPDDSKPFHVICDASDFAIGCALMQFDHEGRERVVIYQSRQLKPAEKNYPVHDKELLAMRYALIAIMQLNEVIFHDFSSEQGKERQAIDKQGHVLLLGNNRTRVHGVFPQFEDQRAGDSCGGARGKR